MPQLPTHVGWSQIVYHSALVGFCACAWYTDRKGHKTSHFQTLHVSDSHMVSLLFLAALGLGLDVFVMHYHAGTPKHPKFVLAGWRRMWLGVHIASGVIETLCQCVAFFAADSTIFANVAIAVAVLGQIPSSVMMLPQVFGTKALTIPFYAVFVALHVWTSWHLYEEPTSLVWLLRQCVMLHGYVYVRAGLHLFYTFNILVSHEYTASIFFAAFLSTPALCGMWGNFLYLVAVLVFNVAIFPLLNRCAPQLGIGAQLWDSKWYGGSPDALVNLMTHEFSRDSFGLSKEDISRGRKVLESLVDGLDDELGAAGASISAPALCLKEALPMFQSLETLRLARARALSSQDKAEVAFTMIDRDGDGRISRGEFGMMMFSWCVSAADVREAFEGADANADDAIDLKEFHSAFGPVYEYMVDMLCTHGEQLAHHMPRIEVPHQQQPATALQVPLNPKLGSEASSRPTLMSRPVTAKEQLLAAAIA